MPSLPDYDVIIAGGGMVGASLALALAGGGGRIALVEAISPRAELQPSYDDRGLALSIASQRILAGLGLWDAVRGSANPVMHVHVSDQSHFGFVRLHAAAMDLPALGYVVLARELGRVLLEKVAATGNINFICPAQVEAVRIGTGIAELVTSSNAGRHTLTGRLLIGADGSSSRVRELLGVRIDSKDYGQTALVTNISPGQPHHNTAYERFTPEGPLAMLPLPAERCAVVFTVLTQNAPHYLNMTDKEFLAQLQSRFGRRLGALQRPGARRSYPLCLVTAREQVRERVVILGNAAHTLHPNGAQGFNLCLRDVAGLSEIIIPALRHGIDPGQRSLLNRYCDLRSQDQARVIRFTDGLATLFYNDLPHKVLVRNAGMLFLDLCRPAKRLFTQHVIGLSGRQPALVRGLPL